MSAARTRRRGLFLKPMRAAGIRQRTMNMIRPDALIRAAIYTVSVMVVTGAHTVLAERATLIFG